MKNKIFLPLLALIVIGIFSCKRSYTIGGTILDPHVNMTTYDYLKTNKLFDTLVLLIDRLGMKEEVNSAGTFFAPSDYSIQHYVDVKAIAKQTELNDENYPFNFDSLDLTDLRDSLRAYMFTERIEAKDQTKAGRLFTSKDGEKRIVTLVPDPTYQNDIFSQAPLIVYFSKIILTAPGQTLPVDSTDIAGLDQTQWLQVRVQTSGIITTTGILHVLANYHTWTFYNDKY